MHNPFRWAMGEVRRMLEAERPFEHVEHYVESVEALSDDERSVLWLFAWCEGEPDVIAELLGRVVAA